jgi:hypothetical protein
MDRFSRGTEEPECSYELIEAIERDGVVQSNQVRKADYTASSLP